MNFHQQKFNDLNFLEIHYVPSTDWLSEGMNELPHIVWNSISVVVAVLSSYSSILIKYEDMSRVEETCLIVSLLGWSFWYNFLLLFSLSTQSFVDLQFPNGQLTYVSGEGLTTSAFLPICGGLLQAQGQYPGEMRFSFSCKVRLRTCNKLRKNNLSEIMFSMNLKWILTQFTNESTLACMWMDLRFTIWFFFPE